MHERIRLMNPGPVTLSERVRNALLCADLCHREPQFARLMAEVRRELARVYPDAAEAFSAVLLTGSGTAAVEAMVGSLVGRDGKALVVANGVYGERMASMLQTHGKAHTVVKHDWIEPMRLLEIDRALGADRGLTHVLAVHHETTTGRLNDLGALAEICRRHNVPMLLDAVSSFGGEWIDFAGWPIEAVAATANKCLHGVPGISFVLARTSVLRQRPSASPCLYLDLQRNFTAQEQGVPLFTPAVQVLAALREALDELTRQGGWRPRHAHYANLSRRLRDALAKLGLKPLLPDDADYGATLTSFELPSGLTFDDLYPPLRDRRFVIYPGQRSLFERIFRLAVMGDLGSADIDELVGALGRILASAPAPAARQAQRL